MVRQLPNRVSRLLTNFEKKTTFQDFINFVIMDYGELTLLLTEELRARIKSEKRK